MINVVNNVETKEVVFRAKVWLTHGIKSIHQNGPCTQANLLDDLFGWDTV